MYTRKALYMEFITSLLILISLGFISFSSMDETTQSASKQAQRAKEISYLKDLQYFNTAIALEVDKAFHLAKMDVEKNEEFKERIEDYYKQIDEREQNIQRTNFKELFPQLFKEVSTVFSDFKATKKIIFKNFFPLRNEKKELSKYLYVINSYLETNVDNLNIILNSAELNVAKALEEMDESIATLLNYSVVIFALVLILFVLFLFLIHKRMQKPLRELIDAIETIGHGKADFSTLLGRKDIFGVLGKSVKEIDLEICKKTELIKENEKVLKHQAHFDSLTKLPNRFLMQDRLEYSISKARIDNTQIAVMFIDLDRFKAINDSLGHHVGDKVLQETSHRFSQSIRKKDTLARLGGDEFTIILNDFNKREDINCVAEKILETLISPILIDEHEFYISASIGISVYPNDGESIESLLRHADLAMYEVKKSGRNDFQFYTPLMSKDSLKKLSMDSQLHKALLQEEFIVYYQPQLNIHTDELIGMEALIRWNHPERGILSPIEFIPLAEEMGIINHIDDWVCETVCKQIVQWQSAGIEVVNVAVNLSGKQLQRDDLVESMVSILERTSCPAQYLSLEVTEGFIMHDHEKSIKVLSQLRDLGINLAIDDFGTGYSSLSYLKHLPINKLKIDRSFIHNITSDYQDRAIVKTIVSLAKSLHLEVLAEGVETKQQYEFLKQLSCNEIQGYFYAPPLPVDEVVDFFDDKMPEAL